MYDVRQIKRIFAVISLNTVLLSTGCTVVQTTPQKIANPMTGGFTAEVTITNADSESKATLTRYGTDAWCVLFSEPQTLAGVQLDFLDDEVKASYKGLEFSVPQSAQAIRTELEDLMNIIDDMALSPDLNGKTEENKTGNAGSWLGDLPAVRGQPKESALSQKERKYFSEKVAVEKKIVEKRAERLREQTSDFHTRLWKKAWKRGKHFFLPNFHRAVFLFHRKRGKADTVRERALRREKRGIERIKFAYVRFMLRRYHMIDCPPRADSRYFGKEVFFRRRNDVF